MKTLRTFPPRLRYAMNWDDANAVISTYRMPLVSGLTPMAFLKSHLKLGYASSTFNPRRCCRCRRIWRQAFGVIHYHACNSGKPLDIRRPYPSRHGHRLPWRKLRIKYATDSDWYLICFGVSLSVRFGVPVFLIIQLCCSFAFLIRGTPRYPSSSSTQSYP